jgi:hypothetical protein
VENPRALQWLLLHGADPNSVNEFGKTALMTAAQRNAHEAVDILLQSGADPNAATVAPADRCTYTLEQFNVTPLHYAARAGSAPIVESLLQHGAAPFIRLSSGRGQNDYPLDEVKRNATLSSAALADLRGLLRVPADAELAATADRLVLESEAQYAKSDVIAAYRSIKLALQARPADERALSDMSLIGLRAKAAGPALAAAHHLIRHSAHPATVAKAWFNAGLACEQLPQRYFFYDGQYYCRWSGVFPFLQSWVTEPSAARAEKLNRLFAADKLAPCPLKQPDGTVHRYIFAGGNDSIEPAAETHSRVYVQHPLNSSVQPPAAWPLRKQYSLDRFAISVLEANPSAGADEKIRAAVCENKSVY